MWHGLDYDSLSFCDKFNQLRSRVRRWQLMKYSATMDRSRVCESKLATHLHNPIPQDAEELETFQSKKLDLSIELNNLRIIQDQCWKQKARVKLLKKRDLNTSFFHKVPLSHRRANLITPAMISLEDNASTMAIKTAVSEIFKQRFQWPPVPHIANWLTEFPCLDIQDAESLEVPFTEKEVF